VRICGYGSGTELLAREFNQVVSNQFRLKFRIPTPPELALMRTQHRDITKDEKRDMLKIRAAFENLPPELRDRLLKELTGEE
jgi:superfamily I DNA and RNA helicase